MKKILIIIVIFSLFVSCEKEPKELKVETVSVKVQDDGSVLVTGKIISGDKTSNDKIGFCMSEDPNPGTDDNPISDMDISGSSFKVIYDDFELNTKYYFRAWANNQNGRSLGNVIMVDSIKAQPVVAPCNLTINTVNDGTLPNDEKYITKGIDTHSGWEIGGYSANSQVSLDFGKKPSTGIYTTVLGMDIGKKEVRISALVDNYYYASSGSKVYVNEYEPGKYEVTVCGAPIKYATGTTYSLRTRLQVP